MQCPRCHAENREGRRFCGDCGLSLAQACPACGFLNEGSEKSCGGCGARAAGSTMSPETKYPSPESHTPKHLAQRILTSKAALEGERKQVTVRFADLKSSMELLADRDPEEARKLLDPVVEPMMGWAERAVTPPIHMSTVFALYSCTGERSTGTNGSPVTLPSA